MKILDNVEILKELAEEIDSLSDYYDEIYGTTEQGSLELGRDKMKYVRAQILKKTFEMKNILRRIEIEEKPRASRARK